MHAAQVGEQLPEPGKNRSSVMATPVKPAIWLLSNVRPTPVM